MIERRGAALVLGSVLWVMPFSALAATITFDVLLGPNGTPYPGHTEAGFDLTATGGDWQEAFVVGNPTPSIFTLSDSASLLLNDSTGDLFTFESLDLGTGSTFVGSYSYLVTGFNSGSTVLSVAGVFTGSLGFQTILSTDPTVALDELTIQLTRIAFISSFNVDNIVLGVASAPVPEPNAVFCFVVGGLALAARMRRRSA